MMKKSFVLSLLVVISSFFSLSSYAKDTVKKQEKEQVKIGEEYDMFLDGPIKGPDTYRKFFMALTYASEKDTFRIHINTEGGSIPTVIQLYNALRETKAHTIAIVYTAYSAGSMLMLSCKEIQLKKFSTVMVHSFTYGTRGSAPNVESETLSMKQLNEDMIKTLYKDFLSKEEIAYVLSGGSIWSQGKDLEQRVKNWSKNKK